jgi:hypothetical protein
MAAQTVEVSTAQISVTKGTNLTDQVLATVGGAVQEVQIKKVERIGDVTTYFIIIIHDNVATTALEWTKREVAITKGATDKLDEALAVLAGNTVGVDIDLLEINGDVYTYTVIDVHLNA